MTKFYPRIKHTVATLMLLVSVLTFFAHLPAQGQFLRAQGTQIVNANGTPINLVGMNLGNWLLWEGYLMMGDFNYRTHTQFFNSVKDAFGGNLQQAMEFEHQWRLNYVNPQAILELKNMGFNSVRVPFHYNLFWDGNGLTDRGFQYFDRIITYCRNNGMYVLLDMHAAPGYLTIRVSETAAVEILDMSGRMIHQAQVRKSLQLEKLKTGIYLVRMLNQQGIETRKLVVQ